MAHRENVDNNTNLIQNVNETMQALLQALVAYVSLPLPPPQALRTELVVVVSRLKKKNTLIFSNSINLIVAKVG